MLKKQYCIGTWNVRSLDQGKLVEVVNPEAPSLTVTSLVLDGVKRWVFTSKYTPFSLCPTSTRISQHLSQIWMKADSSLGTKNTPIPWQARHSLLKYLWITHIHFPECKWEKSQLIKSRKKSFILHQHTANFLTHLHWAKRSPALRIFFSSRWVKILKR